MVKFRAEVIKKINENKIGYVGFDLYVPIETSAMEIISKWNLLKV